MKKSQKRTGLVIMSTLSIFVILVALVINFNTNNKVPNSPFDNNIENKERIIIKSFKHPSGEYFPQDKLEASVTIYNATKEEKELWVQLKVKDKLGDLVYSNVEKELISSEKEIIHSLSWMIPQETKSGSYKTDVIVWDNNPGKPETKKIAESNNEEQFVCFQKQENFDFINKDFWGISDKTLGRTSFKSKNVSISDGILKIAMPRKTFDGGEIFSKNLQSFGAYEIRMKLPLAKSSITGFFMYKAPDYFHEIDIELYNEAESTLLLTTYFGGMVKNKQKISIC